MAKYPFLSEEWVAAARRIYAGAGVALDAGASATPVRVNLVVTEVPFPEHAEKPIDAHLDTTGGKVAIDTGHLPEADVTVSMDYETARTLFVGGDVQAVMQAFLAGRVRVAGDLSKLLDPRSGIWPGPPAASGAPVPGAPVPGAAPASPGGPGQQPLGLPSPLQLASQLQEITE